MKKTELLLDVIGEAKDEYLQEIDSRMERVRHRRMWKRGILAACLILIVGVAVQFGVVFGGGFGANCSYGPQGISAGGYFYYELPGDGFFRYSIEDDDEVSADDLNSPSIKDPPDRWLSHRPHEEHMVLLHRERLRLLLRQGQLDLSCPSRRNEEREALPLRG